MDLASPCFRSKKLMAFGSSDYLLYNYSSNDTTVTDAKIFLKTHINSLYFGHVTAHVEFPDELKFTEPTEEESWVNYKHIYNYPKNFLYTTVYLNKPW